MATDIALLRGIDVGANVLSVEDPSHALGPYLGIASRNSLGVDLFWVRGLAPTEATTNAATEKVHV